MGNANVTVHQLFSDSEQSYLNLGKTTNGHIEVWTYTERAYLYQERTFLSLIIFDDEDYEKEWLEKHSNDVDVLITKIIPN